MKLYPKKFKKYIKEIQKKYDCKDEDIIYIEFSVNCEDWKNNIFEDMAEFRTEDDINEKFSSAKSKQAESSTNLINLKQNRYEIDSALNEKISHQNNLQVN